MEDAWQMSKAAAVDGVLNNFQWLQGNLATLEVSLSLASGQVVQGANQRLADFLGFKSQEEMATQLKLVAGGRCESGFFSAAWAAHASWELERAGVKLDAPVLNGFA